jgi:hypothetical protein
MFFNGMRLNKDKEKMHQSVCGLAYRMGFESTAQENFRPIQNMR